MDSQSLYNWVKANRERLLADKEAGDYQAVNIVTFYNFCVVRADNATLGFLQAAVDEYRKEKGL